MADWREWRKLALDTLSVAESLDNGNERLFRSSASRFYYAAYQAMTALLLYAGHQPPLLNGEERECWSHEATPEMLVANLGGLGLTMTIRRDLRRRLRELYAERIFADYLGTDALDKVRLDAIARNAVYLVKVAMGCFPEEKQR